MRILNAKTIHLKVTDKISSLLYQSLFVLLFCSFFLSLSGTAHSAITTYTDEATYKAALSSYTQLSESFEGSAWDSVRSAVLDPQVSPSIFNLGLPGRTASLLLVALPPVTVAVLCTMASGSFTPHRTAVTA